MKVKSVLKLSCSVTKIQVMESLLDENNDERLVNHSVDVLNYRGVKKIADGWIEYGHYCLLPKSVTEKEVDMISTTHYGDLVIYTKSEQDY
jgi:hypothetical protein